MKGFSIIEVILAVAMFLIFSTGIGAVVLMSYNSNRLGEEQTIANQYAAEGIEASRSIRNQAYANLVNSTGTGIAISGGVWAFSGTNNQFGPSNKYTRAIKVEEVQRDGLGNIVASGGTLDAHTKKITSTVSWNASPTRANSVILSTYLTNFRKSIGNGGILVYGNGGTATDAVQYKTIDANGTWSVAASVADIDAGSTNRALRAARVFDSTTRDEKILVSRHYNGSTQYIYGQVFNGTTWGNVQLLASWNAATLLDVQNFDGDYLSNGTFIVIYSDNSTTPKYRTWNGTAWSAQSSVTTLPAGNPNYIVAKTRPNTNEVMAAFLTSANDTYSSYFNGSTWSAMTTHATNSPFATRRLIDFTWSPTDTTKGALVYSQLANDKAINIRIWTANGSGSGSWGTRSNSTTQGGAGNLGQLSVTARNVTPIEFLACSQNSAAAPIISCYKSDGLEPPNWVNPTNSTIITGSDTGIQRAYHIGYEDTSATPAIIVYSDTTSTPRLKKYTPATTTWDAAATALTALTGALKSVRISSLVGSDDMMIVMSDVGNRLYTIIWDGASDAVYTTPVGKALLQHGSNGSATTDFWYDFVWDK